MSLFKLSNKLFTLGLDAQEMSVYAYLCSLPAAEQTLSHARIICVRQAAIGRACGIQSVTTVSRIIDRLQERKLVERFDRTRKASSKKGTYIYAVTQQSLDDGYFFVERRVLGKLSPRQMMIYLFLCKAVRSSDGICWNSYNDIAKQTGMKRETVIQTVNELAAAHHITRFRRKSRENTKVFVDNLYQVVRYVCGKIRKKAAQLFCAYSHAARVSAKSISYYSKKRRFCQVERNIFFVRGSPENASLLKVPKKLLY